MLRLIKQTKKPKVRSDNGLSLVEILLTIAILSLMTLPIYILLQSISTSSKNSYILSSRNIIINRLLEEIDPEKSDFYNSYNNSSMQTITESGHTFGYMRKVDSTDSNALRRRIHIYLYQSPSDAETAYIYDFTKDYVLNELRVDCSSGTTPYVDDSGQIWAADYSSYTAATRVYGYSGSVSASNNLALGQVITDTVNDTLYLTATEVNNTTLGSSFTYRFDVDDGNYLVQLYFSELTSPGPVVTRLTDVNIEGVKVLDDYNTSTSTGDVRRPEVKSFQASVADGTLTIDVFNGGAANPVANPARVQAIVIRRIP